LTNTASNIDPGGYRVRNGGHAPRSRDEPPSGRPSSCANLFYTPAEVAIESKRLNEPFSEEELKRFPLFAPLALLRS